MHEANAGISRRSDRITNLGAVRDFATLGILIMNAVSFGLAQPSYFDLDHTVLLLMRKPSDRVLLEFGGRALGAMLIGVGLFCPDIIQGQKPGVFYQRKARVGFGIGLPLSALGVAIHAMNEWSGDVAVIGAVLKRSLT